MSWIDAWRRILKGWVGSDRISLSLQSEGAECGLACIAMLCSYYGMPLSLRQIRRNYGSSRRGNSVARLVEILRDLGLQCSALQVDPGYISSSKGAWIAHWEFNHFVVIENIGGGRFRVLDPAMGQYVSDYASISASLTGVVIECSSVEASEAWFQMSEFEKGAHSSLRRFLDMVGGLSGLNSRLAAVVILAGFIELAMLVLPFHMKWVVDKSTLGISGVDAFAWGVGFAFIVLLLCLAMGLQGFLLSWLSSAVSLRWTVGLLSRFMSLSPEFAMRRPVADVLSRFQSLRVVQMALTGGFVRAVIDGIASLITISLIIYANVFAGLFVVILSSIYFLLRMMTARLVISSSAEQAGIYARQQGIMMECVRGMPAIKMSGRELVRISSLKEATRRVYDKDVRLQRISAFFQALSVGLTHWQRIALLSAGILLGANFDAGVGSIIVLVILADQFLVRSNLLVDRIVQFKELGVHVSRVDEIASESPELVDGCVLGVSAMEAPSIRLVNVGYRYSVADPWVFRGICIDFKFGESVAIVAPSGHGKSTLVKIIVGLLQPSEGWVEVNGLKVGEVGLGRYRSIMSCVMQDDHLFAGSLKDNIVFFDQNPDNDRMISAAVMAEMDGDINAMPMRYETLVGEMGGAISGGQKQRILLARALYAMAPILVLDEATSHLGVDCEKRVVERIGRLKITRIVVAHRPDSVNMCERVIRI